MNIPEQLLEQVQHGNVLLFIGKRVVRCDDGEVAVDRLREMLLQRADVTSMDDYSFPEAAQAYQDLYGRQALIQTVRGFFEELGDTPQRVHLLLTELASWCDIIVTTGFDRGIERAFEETHIPLDVIISASDVPFEEQRRVQLYKLRGSLERVESLVLTEDDYEEFFDDQTSLSVVLEGYLARKTILFVGYDLADPHFKRLYRKVTARLDNFARRAYAFGMVPPSRIKRWCQRHGIRTMEVGATDFIETLVAQLQTRTQQVPTPAPASPDQSSLTVPDRPYKLLDFYDSADAGIFFGRQREIQTLTSLVHAHRLIVLHGASGVGKTSLLLAGMTPQLLRVDDPSYLPIYIRALDDPSRLIRRAVSNHVQDVSLPQDGSLVAFLNAATARMTTRIVLILDQFEEFFVRLSPQFRTAFIAELGEIYDAYDLPVKIVFSLREDWLAAMSEVEARIPSLFNVRMRLLPLSREQAREAITAPVARLGVEYEPALVDQLLDDLVGAQDAAVMPPQLQLVCSTLFETLEPGSRRITQEQYTRMGGSRGILRRYLEDELARLSVEERTLAYNLLGELVSSQGTKAVKTMDDLRIALAVTEDQLESTLEKLVQARLLRTLERDDGSTAYELAHEYLIHEIHQDPEARRRKQVEELIKQELENWKRFDTLLSPDKLALIHPERDQLRLSPDELDLLTLSALHADGDAAYWLARIDDGAQRGALLTRALTSDRPEVRRRALVLLGDDPAPAVEQVLDRALHDDDETVRAVARGTLVQVYDHNPAVIAQLLSHYMTADAETRRSILETLGAFPLRDLPLTMSVRVVLAQLRPQWRWIVAWTGATLVGWLFLLLIFGAIYLAGGESAATEELTAGSTLEGLISIILLGAIFGLFFGGVQGVVLARRVDWLRRWIIATTIGFVVGFTADYLLADIGGYVGNANVQLLVGSFFYGLGIGLAQWYVLRRELSYSYWWIAVNLVAWVTGFAHLIFIPADAELRTIDYVLAINPGVFIGLTTGVVLAWLLQQSLTTTPAAAATRLRVHEGVVIKP